MHFANESQLGESVSRLNETWQVCTNLLTHDCVMVGVAGWGEKKPFEVQMHALFSSFFLFFPKK